jgi:two-component system LytT family sensor kinase
MIMVNVYEPFHKKININKKIYFFILFWVIFTAVIFLNQKTNNRNVTEIERVITTVVISFGWLVLSPFIIKVSNFALRFKNILLFIGIHALFNVSLLYIRGALHVFLCRIIKDHEIDIVTHYKTTIKLWGANPTFIYLLLVATYYVYIWFEKYNESQIIAKNQELNISILEKQLSESKLQALRSQLNPHFLFNALHTVASLIRHNENNKAIETLVKVSELLRFSLKEGHHLMCTIEEEINLLKKYLDIEALRFRDRLKISYHIDSHLLSFPIPSLLLQPLVENTFKHGLKNTDQALLKISIAETGDHNISIEVYNNGLLLPDNFNLKEQSGLGLKNISERLHATYQDKATLHVFNVYQPDGVVAQMILPKPATNEAA